MKKKIYIHIIFCAVFLLFLTKHVTNDLLVFWGYGKQVYMNGAYGLNALIETWDMKGFIYRFFLYIEYLFTSKIAGDVFTLQAQFIYKLLGSLFLLAILYVAFSNIPERFLRKQFKMPAFCLTTVGLLATHFSAHFQAEMVGVFVFILAVCVYMRKTMLSTLLAGVLVGMTFFLKSPMIVMGGSMCFAGLLLNDTRLKDDIKYIIGAASTAVFTILALIGFFYFYNAQELQDIWDASFYQHTLLHNLTVMKLAHAFVSFGFGFCKSCLYYPVVCLGFFSALFNIYKACRQKKIESIIIEACVWFFPTMYIMVSNCYFAYHYYLLTFPALASIYSHIKNIKHEEIKGMYLYARNTSVLLLSCYYIYFLSSVSPYNIRTSLIYQSHIIETTENIQKIVDNKESTKILYLDDGTGAMLFPNQSYLRYIYPLPIQRIDNDNPFVETETYKAVQNQVLCFNDELITLSDKWFFRYDHDEIKSKIANEYRHLTTIDEYSFSWALFGEKIEINPIEVYKKK